MAKSLRSKWRRKMRSIKRERYGKKELIRLKKMLGLPTGEEEGTSSITTGDVEIKDDPDISEIAEVMSAKDIRKLDHMVRVENDPNDSEIEDEVMEVMKMARTNKIRPSYRPLARIKEKKRKKIIEATTSTEGAQQMDHDQQRVFDEDTMRDQFGNYPIWLNQKSMRKMSQINKRAKRLQRKVSKMRAKRKGHYSKRTLATETVGLTEAITSLENFAV